MSGAFRDVVVYISILQGFCNFIHSSLFFCTPTVGHVKSGVTMKLLTRKEPIILREGGLVQTDGGYIEILLYKHKLTSYVHANMAEFKIFPKLR